MLRNPVLTCSAGLPGGIVHWHRLLVPKSVQRTPAAPAIRAARQGERTQKPAASEALIPASTLNQLRYSRSAVLFAACSLFFLFKFKSKKSGRSQQELCSTGNAGSESNVRTSPSPLRKMSERVPKKHQSLAGHFPTFNETKHRRGPQNIFKASHFGALGDQQRKPERAATTRCCILYYSTLRNQKSNYAF